MRLSCRAALAAPFRRAPASMEKPMSAQWDLTIGRAHAFAAAAVVMTAAWSAPAPAQNATFSFGLWGDMPYAKAKDEPKIPALIADMNASDIAFSLYDGDIKDGSSKCTDDVFDRAITMFGQFKKPVVYIPGDNEWTDC